MQWRALTVLAACSLLMFSGCGGGDAGPKRYKLSGTVTHNGQPVPRGDVVLAPDASKQNQGPGAICMIQDGKFETEAGKGVVGGAYVITVNGYPAGDDAAPLFPSHEVEVDLPTADHVLEIAVP